MLFRLRHLLPCLLLLLGATQLSQAQTAGLQFGFEVGSVAKVVQGTDTLAYAWAGGLNAPQFSSIDLNYDGQPDLYAFDRQSRRSYTFLNVAVPGGGRRWQYAPVYENAFPTDLTGWVLLRDYDGDGRPDLFTCVGGGNFQVWHNDGTASTGPKFVLAKNELYFAYTPTLQVNINSGVYNLPTIQDVNGDGRLDIVTYDYVASTLIYVYLNTGTGAYTDLNSFQLTSGYWGYIQACSDCTSFQPNGQAQCSVQRPAQTLHSQGHNIVLLDLNGDGVLDMIDGRDNCPQLSRLLNSGSSTVATFTSPNISSNFPAGAPLTTSVFPAPYLIDTDFDGVRDLVVAPNQVDNLADRMTMRHTVQRFRNTSGSNAAVPSFTPVANGFLQNDMLDLSEGATPTFGDIDGDGLMDMLVGTNGDNVNGYYRGSIYYYRNVGTTHRPVFRLVTEDYLGLAAASALTPTVGFESVRPTLVDLNRDGAPDLVYSVYTNTGNQLRFMLNTAPAGQAMSFNPAQTDTFVLQGMGGTGTITTLAGASACFFDVDGDGYLDLLLGSNDLTSSLRLFHNRGAGVATNNLFVLVNGDYGKLRNASGDPQYNLSPTVADFDSDGNPDLLTVDGNAQVRFYSDFRNQGGILTERTNLLYNSLTSSYQNIPLGQGRLQHNAASTADLNQDGKLELYIGTEGGGIVSYLPGTRTVLATTPAAQAAAALALSVYPNPADPAAPVTIETAQLTSLRLFDLTGRLVRQDGTPQRRRTLDLTGLATGLYVVQATAPDGTLATQRLVVRQ